MTLIKKVALSLSLVVFTASTAIADPVASGGNGGTGGSSGGDDDNTVAVVVGVAAIAGVAYLATTGALFGGATATGGAATGGASATPKPNMKAKKPTQVKRNANTHSHPAIPGVTNSVAHTHMGPMPHTHSYGK